MVFAWLIGSGVGPAAVGVPVNWAADSLAGKARRWFRRFRGTDDLSRLVRAATGTSVVLTDGEFGAVRRLLEDQQTWSVAGRGTVEDLAARIAGCLPPGDGRTAEDSYVAALTIARGLLEFAVADLDPKLFQQLLLTRLQRMETDQASALDEALLGLHADLIARLDEQGMLDAQQVTGVMGLLRRVLDRLPPVAAERGEIAVYLKTLIDWLSTDSWPQHGQFGGPVLSPAAIERKLRVKSAERDLDADKLAQQCRRLVILGGPGSGKTWLAKRTARRCAEDALEVLAAGGSLEDVELPLYTTCSHLFKAGGDIRKAAVSSALDQLADLGGSRVSAALLGLFTERNAPTVLVVDSLDEARGSDERLRQADTLPWRIVLTSRPSSWNWQLNIPAGSATRLVGELQPLRYPEDVESFIHRWFDRRPEWGSDLVAQIARRPGLQQAATVPLILAFYCIVGGDKPLPEFRRDLYTRVLKRMLTGRWRGSRGSNDHQHNVETCLQTLRAWAWSGATSHPVSGVGTWADDVSTERSGLGEAEDDLLDHVAAPLGPPDVDTGMSSRRFIHRSVREYLVAEHVASLPVDQAAEVLLPHLWHDPDWDYSVPAALAMHPQHDQLLTDLICHAARSSQMPRDISVIDAGGEFRKLLVRIASESSKAHWSPEIAELISQACHQYASSTGVGNSDVAGSWVTANRQSREALLGMLADATDALEAERLVKDVIQLASTPQDKHQTRKAILKLLTIQLDGHVATKLADGLARLSPPAEDQRQAREVLLSFLATQPDNRLAAELADALAQLSPTTDEQRQAREKLLRLLTGQTDRKAVVRLTDGLLRLALSQDEQQETREVLLGVLARQIDHLAAEELIHRVLQLVPTLEDKRQTRQALLGMLASHTNIRLAARTLPEALMGGVVQLSLTVEDQRETREALLEMLASHTNIRLAAELADGLAQLAPADDDQRKAREALLEMLAGHTNIRLATRLAGGLLKLSPTAEDQRKAREVLQGLLSLKTDTSTAAELAEELHSLTAEDRLVELVLDISDSAELIAVLVRLTPAPDDQRQLCETLLRLLALETDDLAAAELAGGLVQLAPAAQEQRQAREVLLGLITGEADGWTRGAEGLVSAVVQLAPTVEEQDQTREALLRLLVRQTHGWPARHLAGAVAHLNPTPEDQRRAREVLLGLLAVETDADVAADLVDALASLAPTVRDLSTWRGWAARPTEELLAAVRHNSPLDAWLAALPSLTSVAIEHKEARGDIYEAGQACYDLALLLADDGRISDALHYVRAALDKFRQAGLGAASDAAEAERLIIVLEQGSR